MRIGVLGAARIAPAALIRPARDVPGVEVAAIAARLRMRATAFAGKNGIPVIHETYDDLLADDTLDAVYIPLPNGRHARWTLAALSAGKHVLVEKPSTANAAQARAVAAAATDSGLVVMEAFHYRYHPLAARMAAIVHGGELGRIRRVETSMCFPLPSFSDIRYDYGLAGGALMDAGCYAVHCLRLLSPNTPRVTGARARTLRSEPRIDRAMDARLDLGDGATGLIRTSIWSTTILSMRARVLGDRGSLVVDNYILPHLFHRFTLTLAGRRVHEKFTGPSSYTHQLRAFAAAVNGSPANLTPPSDSVTTMSLIDDIYQAAGLPLRQ
ncbi:Gfo/Idh/MocA family oxidoreductase [Actinoplanes sp. NBRC 101535]|uniref:Gfo/Idh/MocA family protein n=1 Tax=Actinoplanes sp. NBRC 101535 TaxID=3032196 RepID=UPI0024A2FD20|nr:Gfo/Idh/MocA family oxidoreductase [Actinoplanes sp. NBRC 101535]GLY02755.1 oxidoreductase [Actinoplanes sp. NBRC 101535]